MSAERPPGWLCPWCDRDENGTVCRDRGGQAMDYTLPVELRVCHWCLHPEHDHPRQPTPAELERIERVDALRGALARFLADDWTAPATGRATLTGPARERWRGCQFGAALVGEAMLGALESHGLERRAEIARALHNGA